MEDIKVGETYNVRAKVCTINENNTCWVRIEDAVYGTQYHDVAIEPKNLYQFLTYISKPIEIFKMTEIPETYPKYDPCRLLRKGDKVQVKKRDGRCNGKDGEYLREAFCTVAEDETQNELVRVLHNATEYRLDPAYLELVTPVEELEPYEVTESSDYYGVDKDDLEVEAAIFWKKSHPNAKAAAEAERDRLNAEYRKEQSDDR